MEDEIKKLQEEIEALKEEIHKLQRRDAFLEILIASANDRIDFLFDVGY